MRRHASSVRRRSRDADSRPSGRPLRLPSCCLLCFRPFGLLGLAIIKNQGNAEMPVFEHELLLALPLLLTLQALADEDPFTERSHQLARNTSRNVNQASSG